MSIIQDTALVEKLETEYAKATSLLFSNSPSVLVMGETGAGKSSLINALFGKVLAPVSVGMAGKHKFEYYAATSERTIHLYDSKGLEPDDNAFRSNMSAFIAEKTELMKDDITKGIHCVWYIVNAAKVRWTDGDARLIKDILGSIPTIIVLNKCDIATDNQQKDTIDTINKAKLASVKGIVQVTACPNSFLPPKCPQHGDDDLSIRKAKKSWACNECGKGGILDYSPQGLDELVRLTMVQMPELVRVSFLSAHQGRVQSKRQAAYKVVLAASMTAYAVGWAPLPTDTPVLIGIQLAMAASLASIFGILKSAILPVLGGQIATASIGLGLASLLKFIPGVGTIVGGFIDSSIAIVFTATVGLFYTSLLCVIYEKVGNATAEQQASALTKVLAKLDINNLFAVIKAHFQSVPKTKEAIADALPNIGLAVEHQIMQAIDGVDT